MIDSTGAARGDRKRRGLSWRVIAALAALLVAGALLLLRDHRSVRHARAAAGETTDDPQALTNAADGPPARGARPASAPAGSGAPAASSGPLAPTLGNLPPGAFPYPPGSQPLTEGSDPATQPKNEAPISPGDGIKCIYGPRLAVVHPPDPLVLDLEVQNRLGARMDVSGGVVRFRPDGSDPKTGWFEAPLVDDGTGKDVAPGDHQFTATFFPTDDQRAAFFKGGSHVFVEVAFEAPNNLGKRVFPTVMEYSRLPDGSLNGQYTDAVVEGSLVVTAGVTVKKAAQYRVLASLYAAGSDTAIAIASKQLPLGEGDGSIPLLFFGKILRDRGIDGPYELRYVMLFEEIVGSDSIPGETVDDAYTTHRYAARDFSAAPYVQPAPTFDNVDRFSPSQQNAPGPLLGDDMAGKALEPLPTATVRAAPMPTSSAK